MSPERVNLLINNYAATFPEKGVPDRLRTLWQAAEKCAATFDPDAADFATMLKDAFSAATSIVNYASSVQPLNGLLALSEAAPEALRQAFGSLLAPVNGDLHLLQAKMQAFQDQVNTLLAMHAIEKRAYQQNLRSTISLVTLIRPAENYLYKSTEARYLADMVGCEADVSGGAAFSLTGYYSLCDTLAAEIARHPMLSARLPEDAALPADALHHLMVADVLLNAGAKKLALFGDAAPVILSRSRAGQAAQERSMQISVLQLELESKQQLLEDVRTQLAALPTPELTGQRFRSPAFGDAVATQVQGSILHLNAGGTLRRMSQPTCFLQGHLIPEDPALVKRYDAERTLLARQHSLQNEVVTLQCAISRLQQKP